MTPSLPLVAVVDDDESIRRSVRSLLRSASYDVAAFDSAEAFIASDLRSCTRCLVLDLSMPGMGGLQLLAHLKAIGEPIPAVILTAHGEERVRLLALQAGVIAFLTKPFRAEALLAAVSTCMSHEGERGGT